MKKDLDMYYDYEPNVEEISEENDNSETDSDQDDHENEKDAEEARKLELYKKAEFS